MRFPGLFLFQGFFSEIWDIFHPFQAFSLFHPGTAKGNVDIS